MYPSENFSVREFDSRNDMPSMLIPNASSILGVLEKARFYFGPLKITSGYRSPSYNLQVGGVPNSAHTKALACDIQSSGLSPKTLFLGFSLLQMFRLIPPVRIGLYDNFIHVDLDYDKPKKVWNYSSNKLPNVSFFNLLASLAKDFNVI